MTGEVLAAINATFNATSATLIVLGFVAIRARKIQVHRALMVSAFISSSLFLVGYLSRMAMFGSRAYAGDPAWKTAYLVMLFSHMILAAAVVPLILRTLYLAWRKNFDLHRRWAKWTLPIWLYVSVTGVAVYWVLYQ